MRRKIHILLVEQYALLRASIICLLETQSDFEVTAQCGTVHEALDALRSNVLDVALLDFDLSSNTSVGFLPLARERGFRGPIVILTSGISDSQLHQVVSDGIGGIITKSNAPDELFECIRQVYNGEPWIDQLYLQSLMRIAAVEANHPPQKLTLRDRKALVCIVEGLSTKKIAHQLDISESAVKASLQQLFRKTGVHSRSQLVRVALEKYSPQLES